MADLTKIFTGMNAGPEAIQNNFSVLDKESTDHDGQLNALTGKTLTIGDFVGSDNADLNNIKQGIHNFGFWNDNPVASGNTSWPEDQRGKAIWGWIVQFGNPTGTTIQILFCVGNMIYMRSYAGNSWETWGKVNITSN